ncbi:unnamed protein product [Cyprideis torosa]|uniref:Uncharacterized protein n=1 Tax=Cyprideis torosa TaxID=163714 RepID=A0A7R8ZL20_9CRUS|nr:unnamed protein product [Cyprideis torosa]CAG0890775.1 unnamed protein product [Cyprideis torosa]
MSSTFRSKLSRARSQGRRDALVGFFSDNPPIPLAPVVPNSDESGPSPFEEDIAELEEEEAEATRTWTTEKLEEELRKWKIECGIHHLALDKLLKVYFAKDYSFMFGNSCMFENTDEDSAYVNCPYDDEEHPFVIQIFLGERKPPYLVYDEIVHELDQLLGEGVSLQLICDLPARSHVLGHMAHNATRACPYCFTVGARMDNTMTYTQGIIGKRGPDFDEEFLKEVTPFHFLPVDFTACAPVESMHTIFAGVSQRFLAYALGDVTGVQRQFSKETQSRMESLLPMLMDSQPRGLFARTPRLLSSYKQFKATEFRQFAMYTAFLRGPFPCRFFTLTTHLLLHIPEFCSTFGSINNTSAFPFENALGILKKLVSGPTKSVQQVEKRLAERGDLYLKPRTSKRMENAVMGCYQLTNGRCVQVIGEDVCTSSFFTRVASMRFSEKGGLILTTEGEETTGSGLTMSSDEEELPDKRSRSSGRWKREKQRLKVEDRSQSSVTGRFCHRTPETVLRKKPPMRQVEKYRSQSSSVAGFRYGAAESLPGSGNKLPTRQGEKSRFQSSSAAGFGHGAAESSPGSGNKLPTRQGEKSRSQSSSAAGFSHGAAESSPGSGNKLPTRQGEKSRSQSSAVAGGRYGTAESLPGSLPTRQGEKSRSQSSSAAGFSHGAAESSPGSGNKLPTRQGEKSRFQCSPGSGNKLPTRQGEKSRSQSSSAAGFSHGAAESSPGSGNKLSTRQAEKYRSQSSAVAGGRYGTAESLPGSVNKLSTRQGEESKSQSSPVSVSRHGTPADSSLAGNSPPFTPATGREISLRRPMTLESVHESISMLRREIFAQFEDLKSRMTPAAASVEFVHEGMDLLIDKRLAATLTLTSKRENQAGDSKVGSLEQSGILEAVIPSFALHLKTSEDVVRKRIRWWLSRRAQEFRKKNMSETPASDEKNNLSGDSEDDDGKENEGHMEFELPLSEELPELPLSEREDPEEENEDLSYLGSEFARRILRVRATETLISLDPFSIQAVDGKRPSLGPSPGQAIPTAPPDEPFSLDDCGGLLLASNKRRATQWGKGGAVTPFLSETLSSSCQRDGEMENNFFDSSKAAVWKPKFFDSVTPAFTYTNSCPR